MNHDERTLHDYLDDRLAPDDRSRFERRLRDDPELAAQVASYRALRDVLRDDAGHDEPLDQAFYDRARRRFARGSSAGERSRGFRLVSWEAAGLAAAAILAVTLFVPPLFTGRTGREAAMPPVSPSATAELDGDLDIAPPSGGHDTPAPVEKKRPVASTEVEAERARTLGERADDARADRRMKSRNEAREEPAPAPRRSRDEMQQAERGVESTAGTSFADAMAPSGRSVRSVRPPRVAAPNLSIARRSLRVVTGRAWTDLLDGPDGEALTRLGEPGPGARVVLVGGVASPGACDELHVTAHDGSWIIAARFAAAGEPGTTCALRLPDDGRPVGLDD